jgi:hypothetical protein
MVLRLRRATAVLMALCMAYPALAGTLAPHVAVTTLSTMLAHHATGGGQSGIDPGRIVGRFTEI